MRMFGLLGCLAVTPALAQDSGVLLCVGTDPLFAITAQGADMTFDYLGDGQFRLDPALAPPGFVESRHTIVTARQRLPITLTETTCSVMSVDWPIRATITVPSNGATRAFSGCCRWQASPAPPTS